MKLLRRYTQRLDRICWCWEGHLVKSISLEPLGDALEEVIP